MPKRTSIVALVVAVTLTGAATPSFAATSESGSGVTITAPYVEGHIIVGFTPGTPAADQAKALASAGAASSEQLSPLAANDRLVKLGSGRSVGQALTALRSNPNVRYADPDYIVTTQATSNDPYYSNGTLWGMYGNASSPANQYGSQAGEVWNGGVTGSQSTYVVVIDEGIQVTHPDLAANIWTNSKDPANGLDDDGNGYVDDINGWDFVSNNSSVYDGGSAGSADKHGTHVSGTIGGVGGNGIGVAGVNWNVTMISAKFLGSNGGAISNAIKAVDYATDLKTRHGLDIIATSNSWGGGGYSQGMLDAINRGGAQGILFIAAAGNSTSNNDTTASYPSNYKCSGGGFDCVVAVAAIGSTGGIASFSSYGATTVDLGAPGVGIQSTLPSNTYGSFSGTSMATPHVSGAAALCASADTSKRGAALKSALLSMTTPTASLSGKTLTGGRLDLTSLVTTCGGGGGGGNSAPTVSISNPASGASFVSGTPVTFAGSANDQEDGDLAESIVWSTSAGAVLGRGSQIVVPSLSPGTYIVTATVTDSGLATSAASVSITVSTTIGPPSAPTNVVARLVTKNQASVTWRKSASADVTSQTVNVYVGTSVQKFTGYSPSTESFKVGGLKRGTSYFFSVTAIGPSGSTESAKVGLVIP